MFSGNICPSVLFTEWAAPSGLSAPETTLREQNLSLVALIPVFFIFHLFSVILWFWSWVCLTFSSPWVREILHSVSLYPQPPAACSNQKQRQKGEKHKERQSVAVGVCIYIYIHMYIYIYIRILYTYKEAKGEREKELRNRSYAGEMIKVYPFPESLFTEMLKYKTNVTNNIQVSLWGLATCLDALWCAVLNCSSASNWAWRWVIRREKFAGTAIHFLTVLDVVKLLISEGRARGNEKKGLCLPHRNNSLFPNPAVT